ncbi:hypothetical protein GE09DRAFT_1222084 [Coniochaeta sp. 2T2.1]|nr:hypothetical protein GE09DRAFT_1222084 [Coniochaeta sp. 2T2.1]
MMEESVETVNKYYIHHKDQLECRLRDRGESYTLMVVFFDKPVPAELERTRWIVLREVRALTRAVADWCVHCIEQDKSGERLHTLSGYFLLVCHETILRDSRPSLAEKALGMVEQHSEAGRAEKEGAADSPSTIVCEHGMPEDKATVVTDDDTEKAKLHREQGGWQVIDDRSLWEIINERSQPLGRVQDDIDAVSIMSPSTQLEQEWTVHNDYASSAALSIGARTRDPSMEML